MTSKLGTWRGSEMMSKILVPRVDSNISLYKNSGLSNSCIPDGIEKKREKALGPDKHHCSESPADLGKWKWWTCISILALLPHHIIEILNKQMNKQNNSSLLQFSLWLLSILLSLQAHARLLCKCVVNPTAFGLLDLTKMERCKRIKPSWLPLLFSWCLASSPSVLL